jgi:hypothetical protein
MELNWQDVAEQTRIYHFGNGTIRIPGVVRFAVVNSTHRLETSDGRKFIIPPGWMAIELDAENWSA